MKNHLCTLVIAFFSPLTFAQTFIDVQLPPALGKFDATEEINTVLLSSAVPSLGTEDISQAVEHTRMRLKQAADEGFSVLSPTIERMHTLGLSFVCNTYHGQICSQFSIEEINRLINRDAGTGTITLAADDGSLSLSLFEQFIDPNCDDSPSSQCTRATRVAIEIWQIAGLYRAFANSKNQTDKLASKQLLSDLDLQWRSYKNDTLKLWPQEVLLSSLVHHPQRDGFESPPNYKLLALRPSLGLSYLSSGSPDFSPTINVDLFGIYWWKYKNNKAQKGRGLAASLVWDGDETAYGVTYHHNPTWSATVARSNESNVVLSISFQLAYWLLD